jgi:hypothetical protein
MALAGRSMPGAERALETAEEIRAKLWARVRPAIASVWPASRAPLLSYRVTLAPDSPVLLLHLAYMAEEGLGSLGEEALRQALCERIGSPAVEVAFERVPPAGKLVFAAGSDRLSSRNRRQLDELGEILQRFAHVQCTLGISTHKKTEIDNVGKRRAERIQKYLAEQKEIAAQRLLVETVEGPRDVVVLGFVPPPQP